MKRIAIIASLALTLFGGANAAEPLTPQEQQLISAIKEIQTQQVVIADNQAKIEARVAVVTEAVRVARIYSSRSGR